MNSSPPSFRTILFVAALVAPISACTDREPPAIDDDAQRHQIEEEFASSEQMALDQLDDATDALDAARDRVDEAVRESPSTADGHQQ